MQKLSTNDLKLGAKAHQKLVHTVEITIPSRDCSTLTLETGQTMRRSHLITLAPEISELREELLNRSITLVTDAESLEETVTQRLAGVETA